MPSVPWTALGPEIISIPTLLYEYGSLKNAKSAVPNYDSISIHLSSDATRRFSYVDIYKRKTEVRCYAVPCRAVLCAVLCCSS